MWTTLMTTLTKISNGNKTIHPLRGSIQTNHIRESWTIQPRHLVVARDPKCHRDLTGVFSNLQSRKREDGKCNLKVMLCTELEKFCIFNLCCEMVTHYQSCGSMVILNYISIILSAFCLREKLCHICSLVAQMVDYVNFHFHVVDEDLISQLVISSGIFYDYYN